MKKSRVKKLMSLLLILGILIITSIVAYTTYRNNIAPKDSSADVNSRIVINLVSPPDLTTATVGTSTVFSLSVENASVNIAEIVLNYDSNVLEGVAIQEQSSVLALNKTITPGKITVDIAKSGPGNFPTNTPLVNFQFTVKSKVNGSALTVAPESTLGSPNQLTANGRGNFALTLQPTTTTTTSCGDGAIQMPNSAGVSEQCDDGNTNNNDGCSSVCQTEQVVNNNQNTTENNQNTTNEETNTTNSENNTTTSEDDVGETINEESDTVSNEEDTIDIISEDNESVSDNEEEALPVVDNDETIETSDQSDKTRNELLLPALGIAILVTIIILTLLAKLLIKKPKSDEVLNTSASSIVVGALPPLPPLPSVPNGPSAPTDKN